MLYMMIFSIIFDKTVPNIADNNFIKVHVRMLIGEPIR